MGLDSDKCTCEHCDAEFSWELAEGTDDGCWICPACRKKFDDGFRACSHEWEPHVSSHGEPAQYCGRCAGMVCDEDFPRMFGMPAPTHVGIVDQK